MRWTDRKGKGSETGIKAEELVGVVYSNSGLRVFTHALLKEICFPLETDHIHPLKRVANIVMSGAAEVEEKLVSTKFDVITHHG